MRVLIQEDYRQLTAEEKRILSNLASKKPENIVDKIIWGFITLGGSLLGGLFTAGIFGMILQTFGVIKKGPSPAIQFILVTGSVAGFILGIVVLIKQRRISQNVYNAYSDDLKDNNVQVLHVTATGAVKVKEFEDEGPGFFLDVGDDKIMYLQGQYLYDVVEGLKFPNTEFELIKLPHGKIILGVNCTGQFLKPLRILNPSVICRHKESLVFDGDIFDGHLESIEQDFAKLKK